MSSFRKNFLVLREGLGSYVNGKWISGPRITINVLASAQPVVIGQDMQVLPQGRHLSDYIKIYTDAKLNLATQSENIQSDIFVFENYGYEFISFFNNKSNVINHSKYIASRILKFTTINDWLNGVLKRP
jgi:hypothetical protein